MIMIMIQSSYCVSIVMVCRMNMGLRTYLGAQACAYRPTGLCVNECVHIGLCVHD
jgi:hypothetical protein